MPPSRPPAAAVLGSSAIHTAPSIPPRVQFAKRMVIAKRWIRCFKTRGSPVPYGVRWSSKGPAASPPPLRFTPLRTHQSSPRGSHATRRRLGRAMSIVRSRHSKQRTSAVGALVGSMSRGLGHSVRNTARRLDPIFVLGVSRSLRFWPACSARLSTPRCRRRAGLDWSPTFRPPLSMALRHRNLHPPHVAMSCTTH